jgi:hypothetical protein
MSSGSASHKSTSDKPNVNKNSVIDPNPGDTPTEPDYSRDDQDVTPVNPAALERPDTESSDAESNQ